MSVKQRILRSVGVLLNCALFLLCCCTLAVMAATWTDVPGKRAGTSTAFKSYQPGITDWHSCQQACAEATDCRMFMQHQAYGCSLGQDGKLGLVLGVQRQRDGQTIGQIDANGTLIWLGAGEKTISHAFIDYSPEVQSVAQCRQKCDSPRWVPPCLAVEWSSDTSTKCFFYAGYFNATQMQGGADSAIKHADVPDPTGYGTRIAASKLPPPAALLNGAIPPYVVMRKDLPSGLALQAGMVVQDVAECATLRHTTDNCYSFVFKPNHPDNNCNLFDYAAKGVMHSDFMHQYGIIGGALFFQNTSSKGAYSRGTSNRGYAGRFGSDRDGPPGNIVSIVPTSYGITPTAIKSVTDVSLTMDQCATLCYEHHEPFYCTMFRLVDDATCSLYTIDYFHHLESIAFAEPPAGTVFGRIDDGRRAFHHPTDSGEPIRQMDDVRPLPTQASKPAAVLYLFNTGTGRNGTAPREVAPLRSGSNENKELFCAAECFTRRQWCRGVSVDVDTVGNVCRMYETPVGGSDQLVNKPDSSYGDGR